MNEIKDALVKKMWFSMVASMALFAVLLTFQWYIPMLIIGGFGTVVVLVQNDRARHLAIGKMAVITDIGAAASLGTGLYLGGIAGGAWAWAVWTMVVMPINTWLAARFINNHTTEELIALFTLKGS